MNRKESGNLTARCIKPRFGLREKIFIFTMLPFIMMLVVISLLTVQNKIKTERDLILNRIQSYVYLLESGVLSFECIEQKEKLEAFLDEKVVSAKLIGIDCGIIYASGFSEYNVEEKLIDKAFQGYIITYTRRGRTPVLISLYPVIVKNMVVGLLELELSFEMSNKRIRQYVFFIFLLNLLGLIVFFVLIYFLVQKHILDRIKKLISLSFEISRGNLQQQLEIKSGDELGILAETFNNMIFQIKDTLDSLQREVIERKKREIELSDSEQRYRLLAENTVDSIWQMDKDLKFIYINPASFSMLGYTQEEWVGTVLTEHCSADDIKKTLAIIAETLKNKGTYKVTYEMNINHKDGRIIPVEIHGKILFDKNGNPVGFSGVARDITERREVEKKLGEYRGHLEKLVEVRTRELEDANKELEAFSYSVSHDLRAPLRRTEGFSQLILNKYADKLDSQGKGYLEHVIVGSKEMAKLIEDILNLSRVTRKEVKKEKFNMSQTVQALITGFQQTEPKRRVEVNIQPQVFVSADKDLLCIVLQNLLENAWKFSEKNPAACIEFGTKQVKGEQQYFVRDNGAGFDERYKDKLFGVFQRLHSEMEFSGTGIGLAIVQRIMHKHGGRVWAESTLGKGAVFYFTVPVL